MDDVKILNTVEEIKVFSDPYRIHILNTFYKLSRPATVKEIADDMREVPAKVHYHVKKMEKIGILKMVSTKEINGILAKYYEPVAERVVVGASDVSGPISDAVFSETQRMISVMYDDSKKVFLENAKKDTEDKTKWRVSYSEIYLTPEELQDFKDYMKNFYVEHKKNKHDSIEKMRFHIFTSIVPIDDKHKDE